MTLNLPEPNHITFKITQNPIQEMEGNVLFNDTLNTFYLWLYGVGPLR